MVVPLAHMVAVHNGVAMVATMEELPIGWARPWESWELLCDGPVLGFGLSSGRMVAVETSLVWLLVGLSGTIVSLSWSSMAAGGTLS